jgi:enediyne biosynthesis protein E4
MKVEMRNPLAAAAAALLVPAWLTAQTAAPAKPRAPLFADVTASAGITFVHRSGATPEKYMVETFGSGVAWIDYDNDGFVDLYFTNGAPGAANVLYRNNKDGTFTDVTQAAGVAGTQHPAAHKTGVAVGDYDNDGFLDLFVTAFGPDILYRNNGNGTFTDATGKTGVAGGANEWSTSAGFFDYDRDGRLDLYVANYLDFSKGDNPYCGLEKRGYRTYCSPTVFDGVPDRLFHNNGDGTFTDVSQRAGIANPAGKGLGVVFCDYDRDGQTDIYVANDLVRNFLYRNNGNGTFTDTAYGAGVGFDPNGKPRAGMGVDCGDVTGDTLPDLYVTNFAEELNGLFKNLGKGVFEEVTEAIGLGSGYQPLGFGTKMFDMDNDGDLDLFATNGHVVDNIQLFQPALTYAQRPLLYENTGGRFRDISKESGPALQLERVGRGVAVADFDNDGALDIAVSTVDQAPMLLRNQATPRGNWLAIAAQGRKSNRFGLGARVTIEAGGTVQVREINNAASYQSSNDVRLHVGVGAAKTIDRIEILWPGGAKQELKGVVVNQVLAVKEPE